MNVYEKITYADEQSRRRDMGPALRAGFGMEWLVARNRTIAMEWSFVQDCGNVSHVGYGSLGIGTLVHF